MKVAEETSNNTDLSAMKLRARGGGSGTQWSTVDDETSNQRLSKETGPTGPNHKADEEPRDLETKTQHRVREVNFGGALMQAKAQGGRIVTNLGEKMKKTKKR